MKAYALPLSILTLAASLVFSVFFYNSLTAIGSVQQGMEYQSSSVVAATQGTTTLKTNYGSIGSIVVENSSAAATINFYATTSQATSTDDLLLSFDAAAGEGTYTYDVGFGNGLLMDVVTAFDGDVVVTYR